MRTSVVILICLLFLQSACYKDTKEKSGLNQTRVDKNYTWTTHSIFMGDTNICVKLPNVISLKTSEIRCFADPFSTNMVNCDKDFEGCGGGMHPGDMFVKYGAVYEAGLAYKGKDGTCAASYTYHEKILSFKEIATTPTTDQIKEAIYTYGPVWAGVVAGSNFSNYSSGVLTKSDAGELDHAILLVGWDDATSSWVLRNSWGASWGESGYMRIKYGMCKVGAQGTYMIYKDATTGIDEKKLFNNIATVFPNPVVDDKLTIQLNDLLNRDTQLTIAINDVQGRTIYKQDSKPNTQVEFNTQPLAKGMYFVTVSSATESVNYKIVK